MSDTQRSNPTKARQVIDEKIKSDADEAKSDERSDLTEAEKEIEKKLKSGDE